MWKPTRLFPSVRWSTFASRQNEMEVHTEGMVRVMHPGARNGPRVPFPNARATRAGNALIDLLRNSPEAMPELLISPRALLADLKQFEPEDKHGAPRVRMEDASSDFFAAAPPCNRKASWPNCQEQRN